MHGNRTPFGEIEDEDEADDEDEDDRHRFTVPESHVPESHPEILVSPEILGDSAMR